ncbi:MAG: Gfo/Idh/MocA family oxidoreductase [Phycisphaerae bacterium]|nr:Gfo/Idh/MocA family oxidoreductase [Planctomycetota bacterium]MBL7219360.1 Gfo/Idh/MocA family oxidoreductase [Phycisphaerae bacterium]
MNKPGKSKVTRRGFLKGAALGAIALPYAITSDALGAGARPPASDRIVMGSVGIGGRGNHDLNWMLGEKDVQFAAVCDVRKTRREYAKNVVDKKYGTKDCVVYRDLRALFAKPDIDGVVIATGDRWHAPASIMAMRAGKDVYCEKPSCFTLAEGQLVVDTAHRYCRVYQTGTQRLSEANHVFAIEMARSGQLGKIHTVYADIRYRGGSRRDWLPAQPAPPKDEVDWDAWLGPCPWRPYNKAYVNHGWYNFYDFATDVAMWGAHTLAQAMAGIDMTNVSHIEFEYGSPNGTMITRLSNGIKLVLFRVDGVSCWKPCEYWHGACGERFDGPNGWASAADGYSKPDVSSPELLSQYKRVLGEYTGRTQRPMSHVRDFLNCVKSRRATVAGPEIMRDSMSICLAADTCGHLKRNMKFDLIKREFTGDAEANHFRSRAMREPWGL